MKAGSEETAAAVMRRAAFGYRFHKNDVRRNYSNERSSRKTGKEHGETDD